MVVACSQGFDVNPSTHCGRSQSNALEARVSRNLFFQEDEKVIRRLILAFLCSVKVPVNIVSMTVQELTSAAEELEEMVRPVSRMVFNCLPRSESSTIRG